MDKHTPGPWSINAGGELVIGGNSTGASAADFSDGVIDYPEALANLTLASAAPELLEALKGLMNPYATKAAMSKALDAIAKAEGRL